MELAEILAAYPDYKSHNLVADYPKLKQSFLVTARLNCLDAVIPPIGDSGATGVWVRLGRTVESVRGFKLCGDPKLATLAWRRAKGQTARFRLPDAVFDQDPDELGRRIAALAKDGDGPRKLESHHMGRYGQAVLQTEKTANGRALWIHYGYGKGHSHHDCLNLGLYAKNVDMLPDLGYPEYTGGWPKRHAWTANTVSHNTLLVNDTKSGYSPGGKIELFVVHPPFRIMQVASKTAYKGLRTYRRLVALVDVSEHDSYVLDVFRARGGASHRLSYHGPAQTAAVQGLSLARQADGTFAGTDVPFAKLDGERDAFLKTSGFSYLYDVERSAGPVDACYTVDWKVEDLRSRIKDGSEPHLRLHALTPCTEVALASGDPPQNKAGAPRRLRYLLQTRLGENLESQFVTVLEPYDRTPFIRRVIPLRAEHDAPPHSVAAVAVELQGGVTDVLISCEEPTEVTLENGIRFHGQFGLVRLAGGKIAAMRMANAKSLEAQDLTLTAATDAHRGKVVKVDATDPQNNLIFLDPPLPPDPGLVGQTIHFNNALPLDTSYKIHAIGENWISTGDVTVIAGFKNRQDFAAGHRLLVNPGDQYTLPCHAGLDPTLPSD